MTKKFLPNLLKARCQLKKDASFGSSLSQSNETILIGASEEWISTAMDVLWKPVSH